MAFTQKLLGALLLSAAASTATTTLAADTVNIYSYRQPDLIAPLLEEFTKQTGIKTRVQFLKKGMVEKLKAEGVNSPADIIMTVDIGRLSAITNAGVTQPVNNETINGNIPANYRDPAGGWFGLTTRGRVVYADKAKVKQDTITYEELADPKWKGKICTRSGQHAYNIALIASMIAHHGEEFTETWLTGVKNNLARKPNGNDRAQAKGIFSGECQLGIGNTYYVGLMQNNEKDPEQKIWAQSMKVLFPNSEDRGTHVNLSGMALAKHSPNRDVAIQLMEFLSSGVAQELYAEKVYEYPIKPGAKPSATVAGFGKIKPDTLSLDEIAKLRETASKLVDKVGYDDGPSS
ncbi:MAG: Fe(3+) ABC transporter substrate-binding protein [Pseudomonadota bacterium]